MRNELKQEILKTKTKGDFKNVRNVLFVGKTETKYIKLKTKTQNNTVIFGVFPKKLYCYFGFFFETIWLKYDYCL